ncbi:MAG: hypothetical protein NZ700_06285 [Gemmataceae bacterium]|nr:hypothetical protein [Gemmataceae bacterium]MDW8265037.1 hypothetical protein [Gemmataceae bacterium]
MHRADFRGTFKLAGCVWILAATVASAADDPPTEAEVVRQALDRPITLEAAERPLSVFLDQLREVTRVTFVVDRPALLSVNAPDEAMPVSVSQKNVKARNILQMALDQYNLSYAIVRQTVIVTTPEQAIYRQIRQPVTLRHDQVSLRVVLRELARKTGTNIVLDPRLKKEGEFSISLELEEVPLEVAVQLAAELANLSAVQVGNVLFVTTLERAQRLNAGPSVLSPVTDDGPRDRGVVAPIGMGGVQAVPLPAIQQRAKPE